MENGTLVFDAGICLDFASGEKAFDLVCQFSHVGAREVKVEGRGIYEMGCLQACGE